MNAIVPTRLASFVLAASFALGTMGSPTRVLADAGYAPPASDAKAVDLYKFGHDKKSDYEQTGSKFRVGRAEIFVDAPVAQVRAAVLDYANYSSFIPKFQKSKVLKRDGEGAEVYLQIPILHGAATIWAVEGFAKPITDAGGEKVVGTFEKGNVDELRATWRYRAVDDKHSIVTLDLFIAPKLAVPASVVTPEVADACGDGVRAVKARAEAAAHQLAKASP